MTCNVIEINNKRYIIAKEQNGYALFINESDYSDTFIKKELDGSYYPLESYEEVAKAIEALN